MSRIRYSAQVQQQAVRQIRDSHTSIAQVAREVGCSPCTIHTWLKKHQDKKEQTNKSPSFVPVKVVDSPTHSADIILPTGITIRLNNATHQSLASLVHYLECVPC
jgi:transposase-like protein